MKKLLALVSESAITCDRIEATTGIIHAYFARSQSILVRYHSPSRLSNLGAYDYRQLFGSCYHNGRAIFGHSRLQPDILSSKTPDLLIIIGEKYPVDYELPVFRSIATKSFAPFWRMAMPSRRWTSADSPVPTNDPLYGEWVALPQPLNENGEMIPLQTELGVPLIEWGIMPPIDLKKGIILLDTERNCWK